MKVVLGRVKNIMGKGENSSYSDGIVNVTQKDSKNEICFGKGRKHCGKRKKCWFPAFSFIFQRSFLLGSLKLRIVW